jgi:HD-like signal output (HDOD) protein
MKHILFVDDEPMVLDGLRRMLRPMRYEWQMDFVGSGDSALKHLALNSCDVLISDMRMPGMNGAQLLNEVKLNYPQVIRVALSGHAEIELIMQSVRSAHQYLAKPCDADTIKSTIVRACALHALMNDDELKRLISRLNSVPSLPALYAEIMDELQSPKASIRSIGGIIAKDVGMTAKILQLVNSAFFGLVRHVSSPSEAAVFLGLDVIRGLVLSVEIFSVFENDGRSAVDMAVLWQHSAEVGILAKQIAVLEGQDSKCCDYALMAGMLHDVGKLVLVANLPDDYVRAMSLAEQKNTSEWQAEQDVLGRTHMEIGAYLLGIWGLPNPIVEAVAYHHYPRRCAATEFGPLAAVHIADALLHALEVGEDGQPSSYLDMDYLSQIGLVERLPLWHDAARELRETGGTEE